MSVTGCRPRDASCLCPEIRETHVTGSNLAASNSSPLEPLVRKMAYWGKLDAGDRAAVLALPHILRRLEQHHYVIRERDKATHSCLLLSGFAIRHKIVAGGSRQIVAIHMKG